MKIQDTEKASTIYSQTTNENELIGAGSKDAL